MAGSNSHITILTLNVNRLDTPIKRHRLANLIKSQNPSVCCDQETHLTCKDTQRLKIKGWRKIYQANVEQKKAGSNSHIIMLTLNVNGLNAPIKRHRLADWIKSQKPSVCCIQETHLTGKDTQRLKIKG